MSHRQAHLTRRQLLGLGGGGALLALAGCRVTARTSAAPEPAKHLIVHRWTPFCAEAVLERLVRARTTPVADFFVLDHGASPAIDPAGWSLAIEGLVRRPRRLDLAALRARPTTTVPATLMCAGNRRREHAAVRPLADDPVLWGPGAIGTAWWTGVALATVLAEAGLRSGARHVWFEAADGGFGGSIPLARVLDPGAPPVVLAHAMNRAPLPRAHGAPLRAIVPGSIGARSVKWLTRIVVSDRPSTNPYFVRDHRDDDGAPIDEVPVNAAACAPGGLDRTGVVTVAGYALAGAPRAIVTRVEVSIDDGRTWRPATLEPGPSPSCWRRWWARVDARRATRVLARAIDSDGRAQPARPRWNRHGYLYNGWSAVDLCDAGTP